LTIPGQVPDECQRIPRRAQTLQVMTVASFQQAMQSRKMSWTSLTPDLAKSGKSLAMVPGWCGPSFSGYLHVVNILQHIITRASDNCWTNPGHIPGNCQEHSQDSQSEDSCTVLKTNNSRNTSRPSLGQVLNESRTCPAGFPGRCRPQKLGHLHVCSTLTNS
jgi:hypothetical protein